MSPKPGKKELVPAPPSLYGRVREILESARAGVARSVNTTQVVANWLIGREIVEEEQKGKKRAEYGRRQLEKLAARLTVEFGCGYSLRNLWFMRQFYLAYPGNDRTPIVNALRSQSPTAGPTTVSGFSATQWMPGKIHPNLGWTHYRALMKVESPEARAFYEIEAELRRGVEAFDRTEAKE